MSGFLKRTHALTRRFFPLGKSVFFPTLIYLPYPIFSLLHGLEAAFRSCEIKVKYGWFGANYWNRFHKSSHTCIKVVANEDTSLSKQMFPRLPARATFVADVSGTQKCFWFSSETFCVRNKCFPVCAAHYRRSTQADPQSLRDIPQLLRVMTAQSIYNPYFKTKHTSDV